MSCSCVETTLCRGVERHRFHRLNVGKPLKDAIDAATARWMGWTIGHQTSKDYGIPRGMAYLTGFVIHCAIIEEQEAA